MIRSGKFSMADAAGRSDRRKRVGWTIFASIASGALVAQMVASKATRDALFLAQFGIKLLPAAMIGAALVSSLSVVGMSRALTRLSPARVVPGAFFLGVVFFILEAWLATVDEHLLAIAVYAHTAVFGASLGSAFWSFVNERFIDQRQAKEYVGQIASGGTIGGVAGGVLVWQASAHLSVRNMLLLLAGMNAIGLWAALQMAPREKQTRKVEETAAENVSGIKVLLDTPYLRDLAALVAAGAIIQALLDWLLSAHAARVYPARADLLGFFALFNVVIGVASFIAQNALTRPILEKLNLGKTIMIQPVSIAAGVVLALVVPQFAAILVLRGVEAVIRGSLYRSAYELFYTPLPNVRKRATKTIIDVGVDRIGTAVGSGALLIVAHLSSPKVQTSAVLFATLGVTALGWWIASRLHEGYVSALAASLKSRSIVLDDDDVEDLTTKKTLAETTALLDREKLLARIEQFQRQKEAKVSEKSLGASGTALPSAAALAESAEKSAPVLDPSDPLLARAAVLRGTSTSALKRDLATPLTPALAPLVVPLLANDAVVREAVRALRKVAPKVTGMLLDHLLDPDVDPRVRRRIPRVLKVCRTQRAAEGMLLALRDPIFEVRAQVGLALSQLVDEAHVTVDRDAVFDVAIYELTSGRAGWSQGHVEEEGRGSLEAPETPYRSSSPASEKKSERPPLSDTPDDLHRGLAHVFTILALVLEREPLSIAYRALRSDDRTLRGTAFEYLEVVLPPRVREVIVPLLGDVKPAAKKRERAELAEELLRSSASNPRPRT